MFLKYAPILIALPLFSQSFFDSPITPIYIHPETSDNIYNLNLDSIEPYVYTQIPDFSKLNPNNRKEKFIDLILPSILIEKNKIKKAYNYVLNNFDDIYINNITKSLYDYCNCSTAEQLVACLTDQPNSIIIAQAAIESGWGTSRFFLEGFNLFGIHSYSKNDSRIKANNSDTYSPVYVKKYNNILESVYHYLRTLATANAYSEFRKERMEPVSVENMIMYLNKYSERRELYIKDIQLIIDKNNLLRYDSLEINWQ